MHEEEVVLLHGSLLGTKDQTTPLVARFHVPRAIDMYHRWGPSARSKKKSKSRQDNTSGEMCRCLGDDSVRPSSLFAVIMLKCGRR